MTGARSAQRKADPNADPADPPDPMSAGNPRRRHAVLGPTLRCGRFELALSRPLIMGILNVTPDSFSDGGRHFTKSNAIAHAHRLIEEGADLLDIGGESTRPGALPVAQDEELRRVVPVMEALRDANVPVSVDTSKPAVMRAALGAGASMINDICALQSSDALAVVAASECAVCLMHKQNDPATMQLAPCYDDVVAEVKAYLAERVAAVERAGVSRARMVIDPGFGFGKTAAHNFALLRELRQFGEFGVAVLAGLSRKSSIGQVTGRAADDRVHGSVAAALLAVERGAHIVRVHDVAATRDALAVYVAMLDTH